jgi:hypothetical protein
MRAMDFLPLLFEGIAISTKLRGESALVVSARVAHDHETGLQELLGVLIGKGTWGPLATEVLGLGVGGELQDSSLSVLSGRDDLKKRVLGFPTLIFTVTKIY